MIVDCISDLHGHYPKLEGGDLLIVAGDLTAREEAAQYIEFYEWLEKQDYKNKIIVPGNHDNYFQKCNTFSSAPFSEKLATYLCDSGIEFEGLKIWGSPWTKTFEGMNPKCKAFTVDTEKELAEKWALIPEDVDILITHSPPHGIFDKIKPHIMPRIDAMLHVGSESLRNKTLDGTFFKKYRYHIFGHVHEMGGHQLDLGITRFINASHVNERYEPVNKPVKIVL